MEEKPMQDSLTVISEFALPGMTNPLGTIHGGETMKMMDNAAAVCAMRHCNAPVVTLAVDNIEFYVPIYAGELIVCTALATYTGRTSMEVEVTVEAENLLENRRHVALTAYFTMVALDEHFRPRPVPKVTALTDAEKRKYEEGMARSEERRRRAAERRAP